jgi:small subunit ribosomal protein S33
MTSIKRFTPEFLKLIDETSRKCFGFLPIVNHRTGYQFLKNKPLGPLMNNYYVPDNTRAFKLAAPDYMTEIEERRRDALDRLKRRGKGPPKKGQGKRSKKKK